MSMSALNSILNLECTISNEMQAFCDLKVFPSAELAAIRKEVKMFKEQQDSVLNDNAAGVESNNNNNQSGYEELMTVLELEKNLCEKKLTMLTTRRQEEEVNKAFLIKKAARLKAFEDLAVEQSKDPANFRNQRL